MRFQDHYELKSVLVLDILLAKAADDSRAAVESHIKYSFKIANPSQRQKDWTRNSYKLILHIIMTSNHFTYKSIRENTQNTVNIVIIVHNPLV